MEYDLSNGDVGVNVLHFVQETPSTFDETEAQNLADLISDYWDLLKVNVATVVSLANIVVADASGETGLKYTFAPTDPPGDAVGNPLPYQVALVASLRTALNSRSGRGRIYLTGFTEAMNTSNGDPNSIQVAQIKGAVDWLVGQAPLADYHLVVYSRTLDSAEYVTSVQVDFRWDVQRRRANA